MAHGKIRVNTLTYDIGSGDVDVAISGIPTASDIAGKVNTSDIGTTVQAFDADTAKTDVNQTFSKAQRGSITTVASSASITFDFNSSNNYQVDLGHTATITNPLNCTPGQSGSIFLTQDGTGSRVVSWGSYWDFAGGVAPTLSTAALSADRIDYVVHSATSIHAVATLNLS